MQFGTQNVFVASAASLRSNSFSAAPARPKPCHDRQPPLLIKFMEGNVSFITNFRCILNAGLKRLANR